jgi:hypothetical protein
MESDLLSYLAEGVLLVLGQDAGHLLALPAALYAHTTQMVVFAFSIATRTQSFLESM